MSHTKQQQPRGPHGSLERKPLEDRHVRLARLRRRGLRRSPASSVRRTSTSNAPGPGESGRVDRILDAGFKQPAGESVLIQSRSLRVSDPAFTAAIDDVVAAVSKLQAVQHVRSPLAPANTGQIAKNSHAALVEFDVRGDAGKAADKIQPVLDRIAVAQRAHPQFFIGEFGEASAEAAVADTFGKDLAKAVSCRFRSR